MLRKKPSKLNQVKAVRPRLLINSRLQIINDETVAEETDEAINTLGELETALEAVSALKFRPGSSIRVNLHGRCLLQPPKLGLSDFFSDSASPLR